MFWSDFVGGSYMTRSPNVDLEATINLYTETVESNGNAKKKNLYGTPGLVSQLTVSTLVCRGMFSQDGRHWAVIGASVYEIFVSGLPSALSVTATFRGTVANDGLKVYLASNGLGGNQLAISSAGSLYILNLVTNALSAAVTLPLTNAAGPVAFINTYFILVEVNTLKVWFSGFEDGTAWDGLDFFARSNTSDNVVGIAVLHDIIRVWGSKTSEVFYNVGEADYPFLPYQGSLSEDGAINAAACGVQGEYFIWLSKNQWDVVRVMRAGQGEPQVISTPAVEVALASYSLVTDAEVWVYEQEGHSFAIWHFPTADFSWCWDARESQWHQRLRWQASDSTWHQWRARGFCAPGSQVILAGDYLTGNIYTLSLDRFDENCTLIPRVRRAPYQSAENGPRNSRWKIAWAL